MTRWIYLSVATTSLVLGWLCGHLGEFPAAIICLSVAIVMSFMAMSEFKKPRCVHGDDHQNGTRVRRRSSRIGSYCGLAGARRRRRTRYGDDLDSACGCHVLNGGWASHLLVVHVTPWKSRGR